jgi:hypothetical protein
MHAPSEDKSDDSKDSFYEELEHVFDHFPRYHMKILLGDYNTKVGREDIFKPTIFLGNAFYHSVQNLLSSRLLSKNLKIKIYSTIVHARCRIFV